ncbi:hypothetical protein BJX65DRAFT_310993 [Aspergillus insuetus]
MKLLTTLLAATAALASTATAIDFQLKVNYYSDGGCTDYVTSIWPHSNGDCYDYDYGGTNSANIANCDGFQLCDCTYYAEKGCTGKELQRFGGSCASNWGAGWKSMSCRGIW